MRWARSRGLDVVFCDRASLIRYSVLFPDFGQAPKAHERCCGEGHWDSRQEPWKSVVEPPFNPIWGEPYLCDLHFEHSDSTDSTPSRLLLALAGWASSPLPGLSWRSTREMASSTPTSSSGSTRARMRTRSTGSRDGQDTWTIWLRSSSNTIPLDSCGRRVEAMPRTSLEL